METDPVLLHIKHLLGIGEGIRIEYKNARTGLPENIFETICAMLNRDGGDILLGVDDNGNVLGIDNQSIENIKTNLVNLSNNHQKLEPPFILFPDEHTINDLKILHISIPASSQVHKTNGFVFDRSNDGDFRVTEPHRIAEISNRKRNTYTENIIYSATTLDDLRIDMLPRLRNLMLTRGPNHPWRELDDEQLLLKAGLYRKDQETGREGYTLAAILLLGKDETIRSVLPHYKIDALVRRVQMDHYDDRDRIDCNLIEAYDRLMAFIAKHLPDPFHLEGDARISLRDKIFREVVANFLVHREYMNAHPARLIIYNDRVETTNASNYRFEGILDPQNVVPFSKNPVISKFFAQLSWVEEIGSGMMNIGKYLPHYTPGGIPEYRDGPVFTTIIPIKTNWAADPVTEQDAGSSRKTENEIIDMLKKGSYITRTDLLKMLSERVGSKLVERVGSKLVESQLKILILIKEKPAISKRELSERIGLSSTAVDKNIAKLKSLGVLKRIGPDKGGHWEVIDN